MEVTHKETQQAHKAAVELGLKETRLSYPYFCQNEITNDDLITQLQKRSAKVYGDNLGEVENSLYFHMEAASIDKATNTGQAITLIYWMMITLQP